MATTVYTVEEVNLLDGTEVTLKPLNIKALRVFMKKIDGFGTAASEEAGLNALLDAGAICLRKQFPNFWDENKVEVVKNDDGTEEEVKSPGFSDDFEEAMDMDTLYRVLEVCGGVKLNDPNLLRAAAEALGQTSTSQE